MKIAIDRLLSENEILLSSKGEAPDITHIAPVEEAAPGALVFVQKEANLSETMQRLPSAIVLDKELYEKYEPPRLVAFLCAKNINMAHALLKARYADRDLKDQGWPDIHPSAVIHPSARLAGSVLVGPCAVISKDVSIADDVVVMAGSIIESGAKIGQGTVIHPKVVIGYNCIVGQRCIVKSGAIIGSEGYGFAQDEARKSYRIPQTGRVVLEDDVLVGANCCIDRATYKETRVGRGTKFDNLCHVAHNVEIGEDCLLTAMLCVAGSTKIGKRVIASGQTGILDHKSVADDVILLHRAGVTEDIADAGMYAGLPAQPLQSYLRNTAVLQKLNELKRKISKLEKELASRPK